MHLGLDASVSGVALTLTLQINKKNCTTNNCNLVYDNNFFFMNFKSGVLVNLTIIVSEKSRVKYLHWRATQVIG